MNKFCSYCDQPLAKRAYKVFFGLWDGHGGITWKQLAGVYCKWCADKLIYSNHEHRVEGFDRE